MARSPWSRCCCHGAREDTPRTGAQSTQSPSMLAGSTATLSSHLITVWSNPQVVLGKVFNHEQPISVWRKSVPGNKSQFWSCGCLCKPAQLPALLHWADGKSLPLPIPGFVHKEILFSFLQGKETPQRANNFIYFSVLIVSSTEWGLTAPITEVPLIQHSLPPKHKLTWIWLPSVICNF